MILNTDTQHSYTMHTLTHTHTHSHTLYQTQVIKEWKKQCQIFPITLHAESNTRRDTVYLKRHASAFQQQVAPNKYIRPLF